MAERYKPEQQIYLVLAVGPKVTDLTPGNRVLIDQYAITSKTEAGDNQFIISLDAVALAVP